MTPLALIFGVYWLLHLPRLRRLTGSARPADRAAVAMGVVMLLPAVMHFTRTEQFVAMIPPSWPAPEMLVLASGVAEFLLAMLLLTPGTRRAGGWFGVALFCAVWPANIAVAWSGTYPEGLPQSPLYHALRVPFQLFYIGWAAWIALGHLPGHDLRRRLMARYYDRFQKPYENWIADRRQKLLGEVSGTVLELGPGTGINFRYFPKAIEWLGVEPNPHMHAQLRERAAECGFGAVEFRTVTAEGIDLPPASVDAVVATLVLCSVDHPSAVVEDIQRVLRPGGRFYFLEHVAAPRGTRSRRFQRLLRPLWRCCADGCILDRETGALLREAGFAELAMEEFEVESGIIPRFAAPHIIGVARMALE